MIKILKESFQDVSSYLTSSDFKQSLQESVPEIRTNPEFSEIDVCSSVVDLVTEQFPDEMEPKVVTTEVLKVQGDEIEVLSSDHNVVEFNGVLYDFTAHQFAESYNGLLDYDEVPVTQEVITNDLQVSDGVSSVKSYVLVVTE